MTVQSSTSMPFLNHKLEAKITGGSFVDMGGSSNKLEVSGFDRVTGKAFTQVGTSPVITAGKLDNGEIKLSILYTETTGDAWKTLYDAYLAGTTAQIQWTPKGSGVGSFQFTSAVGYLKNVTAPSGESSSGDPIMCEATLVCASYAEAALLA